MSFSILLNGVSVDNFHGSRGLRQGDPLSPFLFFMLAEAFGTLLSKGFQGGLMEGFEIGNNGVVVSHLQFVDDTIVMFKNSVNQLKYSWCVLQCFEEGDHASCS